MLDNLDVVVGLPGMPLVAAGDFDPLKLFHTIGRCVGFILTLVAEVVTPYR